MTVKPKGILKNSPTAPGKPLPAPLARAVPPGQPASAAMVRQISHPFRPSGTNLGLEDEYASLGISSPYVATWLDAQKQREREWLCWHLRTEGLRPPQPMPLPTAGTVSRPGTPPANADSGEPLPTLPAEGGEWRQRWARLKRVVRATWASCVGDRGRPAPAID